MKNNLVSDSDQPETERNNNLADSSDQPKNKTTHDTLTEVAIAEPIIAAASTAIGQTSPKRS